MLKKVLYKWIGILLLFIFILNISYFGVTLLREDEFYRGLEKDYENNLSKLEETGQFIEKNRNPNLNVRDERLSFEGAKIQHNYYLYSIHSENYLLNNKKANLFFRLPEIYGKMNALITIRFALLSAGNDFSFYKNSEENCIEEWVKKGENQEGDWWSRFEKSQEYRNFILQNVMNWRNERGESLDQLYEEIINRRISNDSVLDNVLNFWTIEIEKEIAKEAYINYHDYISKNDYIPARFNTEILSQISEDRNRIEKLNIMSYLILERKELFQSNIIKSQLILDLAYVFIFSFILTLILYYVAKKAIEKFF